MRTKNDKIIDLLMTLIAIVKASEHAKQVTILMIQKILFLAADYFRGGKLRVLSQSFYRWDYGPMSDEVYADFGYLTDNNLIDGDVTKEVHITDDGLKLLNSTKDLVLKEKKFFNKIEEIANNVERLDELLDIVYAKEVYVEEMDEVVLIDKIPEGMHILTPVWRDEALEKLSLNKSWIETLDLMLVPKIDAEIRRSLKDAKEGRIRPLELE